MISSLLCYTAVVMKTGLLLLATPPVGNSGFHSELGINRSNINLNRLNRQPTIRLPSHQWQINNILLRFLSNLHGRLRRDKRYRFPVRTP